MVPRSPLIRFVAAGLTGALAAASIIGVLLIVNAGDGFARCTATTGIGKALPILAGAVIAALAFALLRDKPIDSESPYTSTQACCAACGGIIRGDWRLCPHCGTRVADAVPGPDC